MKFYIKAAALIMLTVSLTFSACGGGGDTGGGDTETPASTLFANKSYLAPGAICAAGGIQIDMGFDNNKNNVLDADEITKTEYVCNGVDASSHPFVVYTSPTPNETDVELDTVISAVFNTEMDEDTITDETFTVKDSGGNSVEGTVSYSGIVAVFTPAAPLNINTKYTVNLSSTIENDNDIAMGYNHKIYFTANGKAAVIYNANGADSGTVPVDTNRYNPGESATVSANTGNLVKSECVFDGWNTKADGTGTGYAAGSTVPIGTTSVILYARWKTTHTVIYNGNDATSGSVPTDSNLYISGQNFTVKANINLVKSGLHFAGWNDNPNGNGTSYAENTVYQMGNANLTLYAVWSVSNDYTSPNIGILKYVPAGSFQRDALSTNISIISTSFHMSEKEITRAQFKAVMGTDPSNPVFSSTISNGDNDPVHQVNWYQAIAFCNKLSISEGLTPVYAVAGVNFTTLTYASIPTINSVAWDNTSANWSANGYRLPTEMEWMWAAMGATSGFGYTSPTYLTGYGKPFAGSNGTNILDDYVWWGWTSGNAGETSHPVGTKLANELGLSDMSGNVYEWCWDYVHPGDVTWPNYLVTGTQIDYKGEVSGVSQYHIIRGGGSRYLASDCTVAYRHACIPDFQYHLYGFRVVRP